MVEERPTVIIGAGIIGLSVAYEISKNGGFCLIFEKRERFAEGASSRNSEVIHGGFLSRKDSLKQKLCVIGGSELKRRLVEWNIKWRECGKIVIAVEDAEVPRLGEIVDEAKRIGVSTSWLGEPRLRELEPALSGDFSKAAWFPGSSVFDTHSYMERMISEIEDLGSVILLGTEVLRVENDGDFPVVHTQRESFVANAVINASGIDSHKLAVGSNQEAWAGCWYRVRGQSARGMKRLVYRTSTPDQPGLGVHTTPDWEGEGVRLGPDSIFVPNLPDSFESRHRFQDSSELRRHFISRLGAIYPHITIEDLIPDQVGIRSRSRNEAGESDFIFHCAKDESKIMHLLGMESPGITASPAIASIVGDWYSKL